MPQDVDIPKTKNDQIRITQLKHLIDQEMKNNRVDIVYIKQQAMSDEFQRKIEQSRIDIFRKHDDLEKLQQTVYQQGVQKGFLDKELTEARAILQNLNVLNDLNMQQSYSGRQQSLLNDYIQKNKHILGLENDFSREILQIRQDSVSQTGKIHALWAPKLENSEQLLNQLMKDQDLLNNKIFKFREMFLRMRIEHDEAVKNLEQRFHTEEKEKYIHQMDILRKREANANADLKNEMNKRDALSQDFQRLELNLSKERDFIEKEIQLERERIHSLHQGMSESNIELEMLKNQNLVLDAHIQSLIRNVEETSRNLLVVKGMKSLSYFLDEGLEDANEKRFVHEQSYSLYKQSQQMLHQRILELELLIGNADAQNSRIRSEYDKICQILTNRTSQVIQDSIRAETFK